MIPDPSHPVTVTPTVARVVVTVDGAWTYDDPFVAVAEIAGHVAFRPTKVAVEVLDQAG